MLLYSYKKCCFTRTKAQTLHLHALLRGAPSVRDTAAARGVQEEVRAGTVLKFTCFTSTKVQILTQKARVRFCKLCRAARCLIS
jgi:hypothetical protein